MRRRHLPAPLLLLALTLAAWRGVLAVPFHYDDYTGVVRDEATVDAQAFAERLTHGIRPLLRASFFLDHALWGMEPRGFHLTGLVLHAAAVLGVLGLARRRLRSEAGAFVAAAAFALQPAQTEVVAYVSGRSTGLMAALLLAALLAHESAREHEGGRRRAWLAGSWVLFLLACLAKEVALVYPALLWLWEATRPGLPARAPARRVLGLLGAGLGVLALLALSPRYRVLAGVTWGLRGPVENLLVNARAVPVMVSLWLRPWALSIDHGFQASASAPLATLAGAGLLGALVGLAVLARRRAPVVSFAIGWVLLSLAPTNSFVAKLDPVTEKPLYLAWLGPALLLGWMAAALAARPVKSSFVRIMAAGVLAGMLVLGGVWTARRVAVWQDARTLWADAVEKAPGNARAWNNLGMAYFAADEDMRAYQAFQRAVRLDPMNSYARQNLRWLETLCEACGRASGSSSAH